MEVRLTGPSGQTLAMKGSWVGYQLETPIVTTLDGLPVTGNSVTGDLVEKLSTGAIISPVRRGARNIKIKGYAHPLSGDRDGSLRELASLIAGLWQDGDGLGLVEYEFDDGVIQSAGVQPKPSGEWSVGWSRAHRGSLDWSLDLVAPDPHLYGSPRQTLLHPVGSGVGLQYPLFAPRVTTRESTVTTGPSVLSYGSARNVQRELVNNGNTIAYPTFQVEVDDGSGFRLTDGEHAVEWVGACSRTVPVIVDMGGTVTVNGLDRSVQLSRADWFGIPAHSSRTVRLETLQGGAGSALADIRDTWI